MENPETPKNLEKLLGLVNADKIISQEETEELFSAIISILSEHKKASEAVSAELKDQIREALNQFQQERKALTYEVVTGNKETKSEIEKAVKEQNDRAFSRLQDIINSIRMPKDGSDGKDADPEDIVPLVLEKLPKPEILTSEDIRDRLELLDGDERLDAKYIKGFEKLKLLEEKFEQRYADALNRIRLTRGIRDIIAGTNVTVSKDQNGDVTVNATGGGSGTDDHAALNNLDYASAGHTGFEPAKGAGDNYVTDAQLIVIGNTSGTNTGDQDLSGYSLTSHTHLLATGATDVTASASEVNILDGATLSTAELNYVGGVTSAIQTQLDAKGDVFKVGTPANNQIGVWTGNGTIEGDANFTWDGATQTITGSSDVKHLVVKGHSTQTSNLVEFQKSTTTDPVLAVANDGSVYFRNRVSGSDGQVYITTGVNPSVSIRGDSSNGYYPELNFYMAGALTGWITGYNGITLNAGSGYAIGSTSVYQGTNPFYVKSGYAGVHTVPMFRVRGYQGDNDIYQVWQDGRVNQYGAGASLNWPIARRTGLAASATGTGGTLPTNTYYYKITACNFANETIGSVEASVSITLGQNASLSWTYLPQEGVDHYRIYRSTSSGSYGASTRVDTTYHGAAGVPYYTTTFVDTGYTPTSGTPPTSITHDIMTYRKWEGGTGKFLDFEDYDGTTLTSVNSDGSITLGSRILEKQGADVASANDLTLGLDGNAYEITGTTQINAITTASWQNGCRITLLFTSNPTVKHNTAGGGGTAVILLAGAADFVASAGDTLSLILSEIGGTQAWRETSRTVI